MWLLKTVKVRQYNKKTPREMVGENDGDLEKKEEGWVRLWPLVLYRSYGITLTRSGVQPASGGGQRNVYGLRGTS